MCPACLPACLPGRLQNDSSMIIPSFYQMRPDIMEEVSLGTFIGAGSMGRCYRGMWQVRQAGRQAGSGSKPARPAPAETGRSCKQLQFREPGC